jgi:hypothetical protein
MNPCPSPIGGSGWLAPDGRFYRCATHEHDDLADELAEFYYGVTYRATRELEKRHWLRILKCEPCPIIPPWMWDDLILTQAQLTALGDYAVSVKEGDTVRWVQKISEYAFLVEEES